MASKGKGGSSSRSASFHGRSTAAAAASASDLPRPQIRRPKTHPDLLGCTAGRSAAAAAAASVSSRRVPAKVLVHVTVQRSLLGPLQLMASTEWTVEKLIDEALKQYRKEGRRPLLLDHPSPPSFALHYSQFSLQSLDPKEKLIGLGSRNFFLCPNHHHHQPPPPAAAAPASSSCCSGEADKTSKITIPWLRFMNFLL